MYVNFPDIETLRKAAAWKRRMAERGRGALTMARLRERAVQVDAILAKAAARVATAPKLRKQRPLKNGTKAARIREVIAASLEKSTSQIAREIGAHRRQVQRERAKLKGALGLCEAAGQSPGEWFVDEFGNQTREIS